jgi:hypothetical protein
MYWWVMVLVLYSGHRPHDGCSRGTPVTEAFERTSDYLDAAINSVNAFNVMVRKEAYRIKVISLNNPASTDLGFSLEGEVHLALKPLLAKAKNTSPSKFNQVVSSLILHQGTMPEQRSSLLVMNPIFSTLIALVSNLTLQEKKISREDLDSFILTVSKYFVQYQKLNQANYVFDQNVDRISARLAELQFDLKEFMLDLVVLLYPTGSRTSLRQLNMEELFLKFLDKRQVLPALDVGSLTGQPLFPTDAVKWAKEITNTMQKLFSEYQKMYAENYQQIRSILAESKNLGRTVNNGRVEASLKELESLYNDSKASDILGLRLNTLAERLKAMVDAVQKLKGQ